MVIKLSISAFMAVLAMGTAQAGELQPIAAQSISLGGVAGVAYYTVEPDGYRVVATMAAQDGTPIRFVATLAPGQEVVISAPGKVGEKESQLVLARMGDRLVIAAPNELLANE